MSNLAVYSGPWLQRRAPRWGATAVTFTIRRATDGGALRIAETPDSDWDDCRRCLAGDQEAGARLFKRYEPQVARHMWRFTRDRAHLEELIQETFAQAYASLPRYKPVGGSGFGAWLTCIATRVGYRFWKHQSRRRREVTLENVDVAAAGEPAEPAVAAATLHALLAKLPAADRLVLTLMYFEQCSLEQIAQRTGWPRTAVKMRAYRARRKLRGIIERAEKSRGVSHGIA